MDKTAQETIHRQVSKQELQSPHSPTNISSDTPIPGGGGGGGGCYFAAMVGVLKNVCQLAACSTCQHCRVSRQSACQLTRHCCRLCSEEVCCVQCRVRRHRRWLVWQKPCTPRQCRCTPPAMVCLVKTPPAAPGVLCNSSLFGARRGGEEEGGVERG